MRHEGDAARIDMRRWQRHDLLTKRERLLRLEKATAARKIELTDEQIRQLDRNAARKWWRIEKRRHPCEYRQWLGDTARSTPWINRAALT